MNLELSFPINNRSTIAIPQFLTQVVIQIKFIMHTHIIL